MLYNSLENGYNMVYTYQDKKHAVEAVQKNAWYIISCLEKNGIKYSLLEDVVEIKL